MSRTATDKTGRTILPAVEVKRHQGVRVGFIGMTLEVTPNIVTKSGVRGLRFDDEVETANRIAKRLYRQGVKSIVVLVHEGGFPTDRYAYNSCPGISGPIVDINTGLSPRIDMLVTGHTHSAYNCTLLDPRGAPRKVTSASSLGRLVTRIDFTVDRGTGDIDRGFVESDNRIVTRDVAKAPAMTDLIAKYQTLVAPIANEVIGQLAPGEGGSVPRATDDSGESELGNLIADAQKADNSVLAGGPAPEIAFMNPGGIRNDLAAEADNDVTYGAAFATQPFNNYVVAMNLTGDQILDLLEQQWLPPNAPPSGFNKILQVSGITYSYSDSAPPGSKVEADTVMVNGEDIDAGRSYRVVANSFLADGGDGFSVFEDATNKYFGGLDIDALEAYLEANSPYSSGPTNRITEVP